MPPWQLVQPSCPWPVVDLLGLLSTTEKTKCLLSNKSLDMCLPDQHAWVIVSALQGIKMSESKRAAVCRHVVESLSLEVPMGASGRTHWWWLSELGNLVCRG